MKRVCAMREEDSSGCYAELAPGFLYPQDRFSRRFRRVLDRQQPKMREDLGTWTCGQCLVLACTLNKAFGWPIGVVRSGKVGEHYYARRPDGLLVDGDGAQDPEFLIRKMRDVEHVVGPTLRPFTQQQFERAERHPAGIEGALDVGWDWCDSSDRLVGALRKEFPEHVAGRRRGWCCRSGGQLGARRGR